MIRTFSGIFVLGALIAAEPPKLGHSHMGKAFDEGPRQRPELMQGIGVAPFPITTKHPEVQQWFNQGIALLHGFWYYEAERTFRWTVKLDPDCAMCWWGLSRAVSGSERGKQLIREAVKRKDKATERERLYIDAWAIAPGNDFFRGDRDDKFRYALEKIVLKYPDDIEARALYGLTMLGGTTRLANDQMLKQVLAKSPDHLGANHYRIHNWNYREGDQALDSAKALGRIAPAIGHAQHMPGHIYSTVGMWNEAAISMDSATRVEAKYMKDRLIFPFNDWNYGHNRNYLNYILEQLGLMNAAVAGAKELMSTPGDHNDKKEAGWWDGWYSTMGQGKWSMARTLVKSERWKDILDGKLIKWADAPKEQLWKHYLDAKAHLALGNADEGEKSIVEHAKHVKKLEGTKDRGIDLRQSDRDSVAAIQALELKGLLLLARGERLEGLTALGDAAKKQHDEQDRDNDPPQYPSVVYTVLGRVYLAEKSPLLAVDAFEKSLDIVRNDGFALAGLVEAYAATGDREKAQRAMARLNHVWADADATLPTLVRARATGITADAKDESPEPQRNYVRMALEKYGPPHWEPYAAPKLDAVDSSGKRVTLDEYKGKNVILVFYLGEECPHCLEQLQSFYKRKDEFGRLNTEILAISSTDPKKNAASKKMGEIPLRLLSDKGFENARRFQSYDDFEEMELHSTIVIDRAGRVRWARTGGDPFTDLDFLVKEIERVNAF